jgi:hypothetical protein
MTQQPLGSEELVFCQPFTIRRPKLKKFSTGREKLAQMSHWVCSLTMSQCGMAFTPFASVRNVRTGIGGRLLTARRCGLEEACL